MTTVERRLDNLTNTEIHDALDASGYSECAFETVMFSHKYVDDKGRDIYGYAVTWIEDDEVNMGAVYVWGTDGKLFADF